MAKQATGSNVIDKQELASKPAEARSCEATLMLLPGTLTRDSAQRELGAGQAPEDLPAFLERMVSKWMIAWPSTQRRMIGEVADLMDAVKQAPPSMVSRQNLYDFYADLREVKTLLADVEYDTPLFNRTAAGVRVFLQDVALCSAQTDDPQSATGSRR